LLYEPQPRDAIAVDLDRSPIRLNASPVASVLHAVLLGAASTLSTKNFVVNVIFGGKD
jgi:hypothetical protein